MNPPNDRDITTIAQLNHRNDRRIFGIYRKDRRSHMYIVGMTGTGKSTLLLNMIKQDIENGEGVAVLDPHGDLVETALQLVPEKRQKDVIYFNVPDANLRYSFNPLRNVPPKDRPLVASELIDIFKKIWDDFWGPRLEHILRNALLALLDQPNATLLDVLHILNDREYRREVAMHLPNRAVREFWLREFEDYPLRFRAEAVSPIQNKIGAFLSNPILFRILTAKNNGLDLRSIMDEGKILLVNLSKGKIGEDTASLLGAFLVSQLGRTALRRADSPESTRRDFYAYLDEFQSFSTPSLVSMLSELRKYRMNLILAHQFTSQLEVPVRDAILGNAGTIISFRVGLKDADIMARSFYPEFPEYHIINLPNYSIYVKLMIEGVIGKAFSAETLLDM
jgi:type IV secretory pathway TraG/TraD family ATPase VirD4